MARRGYKRKEPPATCPFCEERFERPRPLADTEGEAHTFDGGRCGCGAVFVLDTTGRQGGQALLDSMALGCDGDRDRGLTLSADVDYKLEQVAYNPRTHSLDPKRVSRRFGQPTLYFFKLL